MLAPRKFPGCWLPAPSAATHSRWALLSERRAGLCLRPGFASFILPDNDRVPFFKVSGDDLGYTAVGKARANQAGFDLLARG